MTLLLVFANALSSFLKLFAKQDLKAAEARSVQPAEKQQVFAETETPTEPLFGLNWLKYYLKILYALFSPIYL